MGVIDHGTGVGASIGRPAAGKTGTTQNYGDAWFVGFVPQLSTAVWVGDAARITPMTQVLGRRVSGGWVAGEPSLLGFALAAVVVVVGLAVVVEDFGFGRVVGGDVAGGWFGGA